VHAFTHCPSTHESPAGHSLAKWQTFAGAVQTPPAQTSPSEQSLVAVQEHGPLVPPHAWQWLSMQRCPAPPQSAFVVHSLGVPASWPGATHNPEEQTVPLSHVSDVWQLFAQPLDVQTEPDAQLALPVHAGGAGGVAVVQP